MRQEGSHGLWTDSELAVAHSAGDPDAFTELYRRFYPRLVALIRCRIGDDAAAQDMAQEAMLRALQKLGSYDPSRPLWPWLRRIALNAMIDLMRRAHVPVDPAGLEHFRIEPDPAAQTCDRSVLSAAAEAMPPTQQEALWLRYVEDLDSQQAAALLGLSRGAYDQLLFRARRSLLRRLQELGETGPAVILPLWPAMKRAIDRVRAKGCAMWQAATTAAPAMGATAEAAVIVAGVLTLMTGAAAAHEPAALPLPTAWIELTSTSAPRAKAPPVPQTTPADRIQRVQQRAAAPAADAARRTAGVAADAPLPPVGGGAAASGAVERDDNVRGRASRDVRLDREEVWGDSDAVVKCDAGRIGSTACAVLDAAVPPDDEP